MLLAADFLGVESLSNRLKHLEARKTSFSFGTDIDEAHRVLLDESVSVADKLECLLTWVARHQPCLFGRIGAKSVRGFGIDVCWIDETDLAKGDGYVSQKIQVARRIWKDRTATGISHGFVIMFNSKHIAYAKPSYRLVGICKRACDLYLVEHAPIDADVIYTEAMPLIQDGAYKLFKAGVNVLYSGAHRTRNHDRRCPGGLLISVNSPGHLANSLVSRRLAASLEEATDLMMDLALRSIGNGGIGHTGSDSTSWHNREQGPTRKCPVMHLPASVPIDASHKTYSARYHTDVAVPSEVTADAELDLDRNFDKVWEWLVLDYITTKDFSASHVNYGLFHGHPISMEARYHNPWPPRRAYNEPLHDY